MPNEDSPFKAIMLAFSGGGYRAAAFHLGLLKMFNELGLRQCIRGLSTISGGTIVGAAYIKSLVDGTPFEKFVEGFRTFLRNTNVVEKALQKLKETRTVNGIAVDASLIRSAANVYDEDYFGNMRFREILAKRNDLPEIAFNTTEFRVGNAFRFQSSISDDVGSGNNALRVPGKSGTNDAVRVADIVAASSCFPSGFEPMRFPSDFVWESTFDLAMVKKELGAKFDKEVPLMDGGVYDNQGIDSSKNIVRRKTDIDFDLFVISDVDNPSDNLLDDPVAEQSGFFTVIQVYIFLLVVMFLAFASSIAFIVNMIFRWDVLKESPVDLILLNIVPLFFSIAVFVLILGVKTKASELLAKVEKTMELAVWPAIQQLKVSEVFELIFSRVDSLVVMASSVFMKRIRGLEQDLVKKSTKTGPMSFFALIYGLETEVPSERLYKEKDWQRFLEYQELIPSAELLAVTKEARNYGTNLWFLETDNKNLDNLIRCGEVTVCYALLVYLLRYKLEELKVVGSPEKELFEKVRTTWNSLNATNKAAAAKN